MIISPVIKQTCLYALSIGLMRGISLLMLPLVARYLSPNEFGEVELLSSIAILGSVMVGLGLEDALYRFVGKEKDENKRKHVAGLIFTLAFAVGILFFLIMIPVIWYLESHTSISISIFSIKLVIAILAVEGIIAIPLGWLRIRDRALIFCFFNVFRVFIQAILTILLLQKDYGVDAVFIAGLTGALLQAIGLSIVHIHDTGFYFNKKTAKNIIMYSLPLVGSGLLAFGLNGFDRWVILDTLSLIDVAIYGIAAKFAIGLTILMQPFGMWWMPRRFILLNEINGQDNVLRYSILGLLLLVFLMLIIGLISPWIINMIMPKSYAQSGVFLVGMLIIVAIKEACELINIGCFIDKSTQLQLWINIGATLIGCFGMLFLVPSYNLWGVIYALGIAQAFRLHLFFYFSQRRIPLAYPIKQLYLFFISSVASLIIGLELSSMILNTTLESTMIMKYPMIKSNAITYLSTALICCLTIVSLCAYHIFQYVFDSKSHRLDMISNQHTPLHSVTLTTGTTCRHV